MGWVTVIAVTVTAFLLIRLWREDFSELRPALSGVAISLLCWFGYGLSNPMLDAAQRFETFAYGVFVVLAVLAFLEIFVWQWSVKVFTTMAAIAMVTVALGSHALGIWSFIVEHVF